MTVISHQQQQLVGIRGSLETTPLSVSISWDMSFANYANREPNYVQIGLRERGNIVNAAITTFVITIYKYSSSSINFVEVGRPSEK